jgi:hypothetical protein
MKRLIIITTLSFVLAITSVASAAIPHLINYQGKLTDSNGVPLNGTYNITFRIYNAQTSGNLLWEEPHTQANGTQITITNGIFSIMLGSVTPLNLSFDQPYWLSIQVGGDPEMTPRQQITSVGYAINAEQLSGKQINEFILAPANSQQGDVLIRDAQSWTKLAAGSPGQILKTQGPGANPVWASAGRQLFTSSGTFTAPTGVTTVYITAVGGGGGGAAGYGAMAGSGGGGGSFLASFPVTVQAGNNYTVTIGAGGAGGIGGGAAGGAGEDTTFSTLATVKGGGMGYYGGPGGVGGGTPSGNIGGVGYQGVFGATFNSAAGGGGGSPFGAGGNGGATGSNATGYGTGGGGGLYGGGNGAAGFCLVEW